jgi:hypothetical protein
MPGGPFPPFADDTSRWLSSKIGSMRIGMLLFPRLSQLDLTGPYEVLSRLSDTSVLLLWKAREAVISDCGMSITPTIPCISDVPLV